MNVGDPRVLGVEAVRADVEVEVAVVKRAAQAADHAFFSMTVTRKPWRAS